MGVPDNFEDVLDFQALQDVMSREKQLLPQMGNTGALIEGLQRIDGLLKNFQIVADQIESACRVQLETVKIRFTFYRSLAMAFNRVHASLMDLKNILETQEPLREDEDF